MKKARFGDELVAAATEALAHARWQRRLREWTVEVPEPANPWPRKKIVALRKKRYKVSQPVFAAILNVTPSTVRAWEQGHRTPDGAACRLLQVAEADPKVFQRIAHAA
jgi:putative transcriptional regulator